MWVSQVAPGIDLIRLGHRQVVAWPSVHPSRGSGYAYVWTSDQDNVIHGPLPKASELPVLPEAWCELLLKPKGRQMLGWEAEPEEAPKRPRKAGTGHSAAPERDTDEEVYSEHWSGGGMCAAVKSALEHWVEQMAENSRYDSVRDGVVALTRLGEQGHMGVMPAVEALKEAYHDAVGSERDIEAEWGRMCAGLDEIGQVGVGDEAGAQAVGPVGGWVEVGAGDGGLDQRVNRLRVQRSAERPVTLKTGRSLPAPEAAAIHGASPSALDAATQLGL